MIIVISPAKNLDYDSVLPTEKYTKAKMLDDSQELIDNLVKMSPEDLSKLMGISDKLGILNFKRYQTWQLPFDKNNARQALFAFKGDVYTGMDAYNFDSDDLEFAQKNLRILSGLYGLLRPLDLIQPYRLEMGTKFENARGKDLYSFWGEKITQELNKELAKGDKTLLINLASNEYFKSIHTKSLNADVITPVFKDMKNGKYKIISFFAKKARGMMSAYIIKNKLTQAKQLRKFDAAGYAYNDTMSTPTELVFLRNQS